MRTYAYNANKDEALCTSHSLDCDMTRDPTSDPSVSLALESQLCFDLYVAARAITGAHRPLLAALNLTYPQYLAMIVLWQHGPQLVTELGIRLNLDSGTLSPMLKRLDTAGYVTRTKGSVDERATIITLTPMGAALKERASGIPAQVACSVRFSEAEKRSLQQQLRVLTARLQDD